MATARWPSVSAPLLSYLGPLRTTLGRFSAVQEYCVLFNALNEQSHALEFQSSIQVSNATKLVRCSVIHYIVSVMQYHILQYCNSYLCFQCCQITGPQDNRLSNQTHPAVLNKVSLARQNVFEYIYLLFHLNLFVFQESSAGFTNPSGKECHSDCLFICTFIHYTFG